jgi:hypothetical protein
MIVRLTVENKNARPPVRLSRAPVSCPPSSIEFVSTAFTGDRYRQTARLGTEWQYSGPEVHIARRVEVLPEHAALPPREYHRW